MRSGWFLLGILALLVATTPAHAAGSIRLRVTPQVLVADGHSTAIVTAEVRDSRGNSVRNGTEVRFSTTAGTVTEVAFTSSGVARATLTAANIPASAMVTAFSNTSSAFQRVQMVSQLVEANAGGRVLRMNGEYVAYSEDNRFLDAAQNARVQYRGVTVHANAIQVAIGSNTLKAFGKVEVKNGEKQIEGAKLVLDLNTMDGYLLDIGKKFWFNGFGLNELPKPPANGAPSFEFEDLSTSTLLWVGKSAVYVPNEKVQVRGSKAYVGGMKTFRVPYHEDRFDATFGEQDQYLGVGTDGGLVVDIPFYLQMAPSSATSVRLRHGERRGFGFYNTRPGFGLDIERRYGFSGGNSEGMMTLEQVTSPDQWGFHWNHTQRLSDKTRVFAMFDAPQHEQMFGQLNLNHGLSFGNATVNLSANKLRKRGLGRTLDAAFESKPVNLANGLAALSLETRYTDVTPGNFERVLDKKFDIEPNRTQSVGLKLRGRPVDLMDGMSWNNAVSVRQQWGTYDGVGLGFNSGINYTLPNNGMLTLNYDFNQYQLYRSVTNQGLHRLSATLAYQPHKRLRLSAFSTMALDAETRTLTGQLSYAFGKRWRMDMLHSSVLFGPYQETDLQFGIARALGDREILVYWSSERHRVDFEFGLSRF